MKYHVPVLLNESIEGLNINPKGIYVDATFGGGGHSSSILKQLKGGKLFGIDQDSEAKQNIPNDSQFTFIHHNFAYLKNFLTYYNSPQIDGILADLGVSSHHFDTAERGFSFRFEGDLDMRMDRNNKKTAQEIINNYDETSLTKIFREYGEINNARKLAQVIIAERTLNPIQTTEELKKICTQFCNAKTESKYLSQIFQALRIEVNNEMGVLKDFLEAGLDVLKPKGRFVIITYHSLEDRLVKNFFKTGNTEGTIKKDFFGNIESPFELITKKIITPNEQELLDNNRSRSAKLRIAEKK